MLKIVCAFLPSVFGTCVCACTCACTCTCACCGSLPPRQALALPLLCESDTLGEVMPLGAPVRDANACGMLLVSELRRHGVPVTNPCVRVRVLQPLPCTVLEGPGVLLDVKGLVYPSAL